MDRATRRLKSTTTTTMPNYGYNCLPSPSCMHGRRERVSKNIRLPLSKTTPATPWQGRAMGADTRPASLSRGQTVSLFGGLHRRIQQPRPRRMYKSFP